MLGTEIGGEHGGYTLTATRPDGTPAGEHKVADWDALCTYLVSAGVPEDRVGDDTGTETLAGEGGATLTWAPTPPISYEFRLAGDPDDLDQREERVASHWTINQIADAMETGEGIPVRFPFSGADGVINPRHVVWAYPA
jgi:hypothetical protein